MVGRIPPVILISVDLDNVACCISIDERCRIDGQARVLRGFFSEEGFDTNTAKHPVSDGFSRSGTAVGKQYGF